MALRMIEMLISGDKQDDAERLLEDNDQVLDFWYDWVSEKQVLVKIIVQVEYSQSILDTLQEKFSHIDGFRLLLLSVKASYPMMEEVDEEKDEDDGAEKKKETKYGISREELYAEVRDMSELTRVYILLIALSAIVAAIGVMRNDVAIIIGAMVIAPLLGPNVALSLSTTLADTSLFRRALKANVVGILLAFFLAFTIGAFVSFDIYSAGITSRSTFSFGDIVLALAAGSAGALAMTRGISTALIGVMVALALLPTLVTSGLLFGAGYISMAVGALILFLIHLISINLSGVLTFLVQGIEPREWWEADKAKKSTRIAVIIWISLLAVLIGIIIYTQYL
ncbi:MAG: TIGR00341 family protein [Thermoplasmata archaeon]